MDRTAASRGSDNSGGGNLLATLPESLALMLVHLGSLTDPAHGGNFSS
jgi:hypothetical protein